VGRNVLNVGYTAGKRWYGWRSTGPVTPVRTHGERKRRPATQTKSSVPRSHHATPAPRAAIRPDQVLAIVTYALDHDFDIPAMADWSAGIADSFYAEMQKMVAEDEYTDD
jgi:hypothetical protein